MNKVVFTVGTFRDLAHGAYVEKQEAAELEAKQDNHQRAQAAARWFAENFDIGDENFEYDLNEGAAVIDGVAFQPRWSYGDYGPADLVGVAMKGACPRCKQQAWSETLYSLAKIGELLETFVPSYSHCCPSAPVESMGARLEALIREIVRGELPAEY